MTYHQAYKMKWLLTNNDGLNLRSNLCDVRIHRLSQSDILGYRKRGAFCYGVHAIRIIRYSNPSHNIEDIEEIIEWCDLTHETFRAMSYELRDIRRDSIKMLQNSH